ncbi:hypothetical protein BCT21_11585 [Vibrio sp. 10N.222.55.F9]|uniref:hypothetical protein n=1 Tax=Vibrio sp. 10N.222.55.F9 TaxID=1884471 RepID=UPI000C864F7A|nr:hypothetical protein [Vibrio sp. 10N.222.55.F9]PMN99605.1 hypothetical protein BCT21_11585 [Vibrio sp. 10N.222.55.F9]
MLTDAMTSIKAYLYERAVSPLLGSLIVSWCVWNYRLFFLAISDLKYAEKMTEIDRYFQLEDTHHLVWYFDWTVSNFWALGVIFPIITAMLYLFVFPYPAKFVYEFSLNRQKELAKAKNDIEDNKQLTVEQSRVIRQQLADAEKDADVLIERKDRAIESRDRQIEELQELVNEKSKDKLGQENDSDESQQELLNTIKGLQKKVEDLENDDSIFRVNTGQDTSELNDSSKTPKKAEPFIQEAPKPKVVSIEDKVKQLIDIGKVDSPETEDEYFAKILLSIYDAGGSKSVVTTLQQFDDRTKARYYVDELKDKKYVSQSGGATPRLNLTHTIKGYFVKNL